MAESILHRPTRAALYLRVSTDKQETENQALSAPTLNMCGEFVKGLSTSNQ